MTYTSVAQHRLRGLVPPGLVALIVAVPVVVRLAAVPPQYPHLEWLIEEPSPLPPRPLPMAFAGFIDGADTFRLPLTSDNLARLLMFDEIAIVLGNEFTRAVFIEASLSLDDTHCRYATRPRTTFVNNEPLWLIRDGPCEVPEDDQPRLTLDVRLVVTSGRVALWTFEDPTTTPRLLVAPPFDGRRLAVRGLAGRTMPQGSLSRADLIAFVWGISAGATWALVIGCLLLLWLGAALLMTADDRASPWFAAAGSATLVCALALSTAVLIPPLQAPDEPDHLLTFGAVNHRDLEASAGQLARRTHFERLRHRHDQHIRAADIGHPWAIAWADTTHTESITTRSPLTASWWALLDSVVPHRRITNTLLTLRIANALLLAIAVGGAVLLLSSGLPGRRPALLGLGFLAIPTLPFNGMGLSDTAVMTAVAVLAAAAIAVVVLDGARAYLMGPPLGIAILLLLMSGRRAWALLPAVGTMLVVRALVGPSTPDLRRTAIFWTGVLIPSTLGLSWLFSVDMIDSLRELIAARGSSLQGLADSAAGHRALLPLLLLVLPAIEVVVGWLRLRRPDPITSPVVPILGVLAASLVMLPALASSVVAFPTTASVPVSSTTAPEYLAGVMQSMVVPLRAGHFDLLLSKLFWTGFGWSDTLPPEWLVATVCLATASMAAWTACQVGFRAEVRGFALIMSLGIGLTLSLVASAAGAYALRYALYGRYLVGWYLIGVTAVWVATSAASRPPAWVWLGALLGIHAYCLQLIVIRYF